MKFIFTYTQIQWLILLLLSAIFAVLNTLAYQPLVSFSFNIFLLKSMIDGLLLLGICRLLLIVIPSANYVKLEPIQQFINYFALGILVTAVWVGLSFATSYYILGSENIEKFVDIIPMNAFIGLLLYIIDIQFIHYKMVVVENKIETEPDTDFKADSNETKLNPEQTDEGSEAIERIAVKVGNKIHVILVQDIIYIEADGDYVKIVTDHGKYMKEDTMKYYEAGLPQSKFVRVHRSYIVNVEKILRIELYEKQNQMLTLNNGDQIRASASGYKSLRDVLKL
ncbi:MAG TPA: LytTR family transcriptional regulator [Fermentimonas caenicola]|jgi:hypothetical protein|uniref:Response regulator receiver protein n=1 Tax=Fermentimonas caenicola TaxID=1562970 RepID=A0A098BZF2_9BACT|nr:MULTISPECIES: LytTR family DNA-binding domain-containing protein [Lascolabacillus]MBP6174648.1 LytTR family transcriptional regulator DNA-binding domain-containing protein [Fermentimonas sp.]MDI9624991.1 LytTR family DNA-binding domain-containing protein [Bacteroidota bacterium]CEA15556.1 response regulator receiver protein [Fermentimonas caenicola]MBP6196880.1 LytTR family transcriptional regulator DNA-binding domain-containing protein [Fermentimonas sp.]MBP7104352.1 LytTR family transcrip